MEKFEDIIQKYNYELPEKLIAQKPASPRDEAHLLIYSRTDDKIYCDKFLNIAKYLPQNAVLVFNETKVLPARLNLKKETGGKVEILYLKSRGGLLEFLADRKLNVGSKIFLNRNIVFEVVAHEEKNYLLKPLFDAKKFEIILEKYGVAPIPPYIKHSPLSKGQLKQQYQTIFAKYSGSAAAPTASLHFTKRVLASLKKAKVDVKFITLHVGLGTFAPLTQENLKTKKLHAEFYNIDKKTAEFLNKAKHQGRPIIAVGTTVARTLEASVRNGQLKNLSGQTDIFISEGYKFGFIDGMVTNFHVPKSSLLMLVSALVGKDKIIEIYKFAIAKKFKFYSFGDGMLIR
jgi:S-adenosylmethionine:tRNA ribosyltransferase-isomerase